MFTLQTPTLLFSAISLLMIAYTSRYVAISAVIRNLNENPDIEVNRKVECQIESLMRRVRYIRDMQISALIGFSLNILSMMLIVLEAYAWVAPLFFSSLVFVFISLVICIIEIGLSAQALNISLDENYSKCRRK